MKLSFVKPNESYRQQQLAKHAEEALKNDQIREFGADEVVIATSPSRFWNPLLWVMNLLFNVFERMRGNVYMAMDDSAVIYNISSYDLKRINGKGIDTTSENGMIILMATVTMQKKYIATINWKGSKADKTKQALDMLICQAVTTYVTTPPLSISAARLLAHAYGDSTPGNEEATFTALNNAMIAIMFAYQTYANANPATASDGIKSGGYDVKTITPRGKQPWTALNSVIQGTIDLTAGGAGANKGFHDWHISFDGISFERMTPTTAAHTQITGLAGGKQVWFMHQIITKDGPQGYDLIIQITVNR